MKLANLQNLFILFFILIVLGFLYRRFEDKRMREESKDNYEAIRINGNFDDLMENFQTFRKYCKDNNKYWIY